MIRERDIGDSGADPSCPAPRQRPSCVQARRLPRITESSTDVTSPGSSTPALRPVTADDIEALAIGAWILGTGGGGSPYLGLLNMRKLYREGLRVELIDPIDLADDDLVAVVSNMGAP